MKFSTALLTSLAAFAAAAPIDCDDNKLVARDVVTVFAHETTYVYANQDAAPAPAATPSPEVKAQAADNNAGNVVYQYVYVTVDQNGNLIQNTAVETKPAAAAPTQEAPKQEAPKQEAPKQEAPKQEAPKQEAPKSSEAPSFKAEAGESAKVQTPAPKPSPAAPKPSPSPQAEAPASKSSNLDSWSQSILDTQNAKRAEHGVGAFAWNETLANFASDYLEKAQCNFAHSGGPYGENLAMGYPSAQAAVNGWYDEVKDYNFAQGDFSMATGHFTQMVWKGSNQLGCAKKECGGNGAYVVCEYYPRGNIIGAFQQNVLN
ncbi:YALI0D08140p [Yarrowia lipolytica CLIB122]|uniref:YALI0D08140p n=1 Tax=Yarrowia lipolytica (strain CLIB 122 / E 150) TaxID=284591 RepID=Q6C9V2_YARLI|nr:YALI0D08140p [Yarrowia lipolytica CLIB122]KAB8284330.1 CAP domain-containing protein [Yarrowia lipolytica]KAE8168977.1 CAP domain-containing protein [Yarrowia lipolytica]KAJ8054647.1 CAP domain-containing protein [Yarrowia lipolytica]RMI99617.1 CAP domain-containing protein [Yarrowia lipolytica]CAG80748.1 YALI0D08140p [Yarrowia lipolytica CLIB122]|eukprot:XP_502560.1 YALI0D08140p [Yarrowia lipolytica CLIB122]